MSDETCSDKDYPEGLEFLDSIGRIADQIHADGEDLLLSSESARKLLIGIGTVLSFLDRLGSCFWGCRGGDHIIEYLVIRSCSSTFAGVRLIRSGFYDEALSLARNVGEIGNLTFLFAYDPGSYRRWRSSSRKNRMKQFSPARVRQALEQLNLPVPIEQTMYSHLSERATHVTPDLKPQSHDAASPPKTGGIAFDEFAAVICLQHLALAIASVGAGACRIVPLDETRYRRINGMAANLIELVAHGLERQADAGKGVTAE